MPNDGDGEVVVATIPLGRYRDLPADDLAGRTVIDTRTKEPGNKSS